MLKPESGWLGRRNMTGRAALFAIVLIALAVTLAYPLREYLGQRGQLNALREQASHQQAVLAALSRQHEALVDPARTRAEARIRLQMIEPGATDTLPLTARPSPTTPPNTLVDPLTGDRTVQPWYRTLWESVQKAGKGG